MASPRLTVEMGINDDLCAGDGRYRVDVVARAAPSSDRVLAAWNAFADAGEDLGLEPVATEHPTLSVTYRSSELRTEQAVLRLDDRTASTFAELAHGRWRTVFAAELAGGTSLAEVPAEARVLRPSVTETGPGAGLESDTSVFVDRWEAAAEAADVVGWSSGEIAPDDYWGSTVMAIPAAPGAPAPDGLAEAFVEGYELRQARGASPCTLPRKRHLTADAPSTRCGPVSIVEAGPRRGRGFAQRRIPRREMIER